MKHLFLFLSLSFSVTSTLSAQTALDVINRPDLFPHPEDKSKGAFVGCPAGWACQLANANLFRAFEMEKKGWVFSYSSPCGRL